METRDGLGNPNTLGYNKNMKRILKNTLGHREHLRKDKFGRVALPSRLGFWELIEEDTVAAQGVAENFAGLPELDLVQSLDKEETVLQSSGKTRLVGEYTEGVSGSYRRRGAFCKTAFCKTQPLRLHQAKDGGWECRRRLGHAGLSSGSYSACNPGGHGWKVIEGLPALGLQLERMSLLLPSQCMTDILNSRSKEKQR